jgi:NitT/TauT family transport system permease protein
VNPRVRSFVAPVVGVVVFLAVWELFVQVTDPKPYVLRSPWKIVSYIADNPAFFWRNSVATGLEALVGLLLALGIGVLIGCLVSSSRFVEEATSPVLTLIQVTPFVAYIASVQIWLGLDNRRPALFIATLVCVPAFTFATIAGLRSADRSALEVMRSVDASRREILWRLRLPSALPSLFTAARYNVGLALIVVYLSEGGLVKTGLGIVGKRAANQNDGDLVWATVFCMAALGTIGLIAISVLERVVLRWHASQRGDAPVSGGRRPPSPAAPTRIPSP